MSFEVGRKYRKLPVEVEAVQWDGVVLVGGRPEWMPEPRAYEGRAQDIDLAEGEIIECGSSLFIGTLEGTHQASAGDFIIRGVKGEIYPCKPDIFVATYEPVREEKSILGEGMRDEGDALVDKPDSGPEPDRFMDGYAAGRQTSGVEMERIYNRRLGLELAVKGCEGYAVDTIIERAVSLAHWLTTGENSLPRQSETEAQREPDEYGHPHGTVFIPPVDDGLVEHHAAQPPEPVPGDARLLTSEELASGNAHQG